MKTGPTPLIRQSIERPFRTMFGTTVGGFAKRLPIMDLLLDLAFPKPLADGKGKLQSKANKVALQAGADFIS